MYGTNFQRDLVGVHLTNNNRNRCIASSNIYIL